MAMRWNVLCTTLVLQEWLWMGKASFTSIRWKSIPLLSSLRGSESCSACSAPMVCLRMLPSKSCQADSLLGKIRLWSSCKYRLYPPLYQWRSNTAFSKCYCKSEDRDRISFRWRYFDSPNRRKLLSRPPDSSLGKEPLDAFYQWAGCNGFQHSAGVCASGKKLDGRTELRLELSLMPRRRMPILCFVQKTGRYAWNMGHWSTVWKRRIMALI